MTIEVNLNPECAARLAAEAQMRGVGVEEYARHLLQEALASHASGLGKLTADELDTMLRQISEGSDKLPHLPTRVFTRESFYEDCAKAASS